MFSELEYHVPAIGGGTGLSQVEDRSQLWAFRGARHDIPNIVRALLSAEIQGIMKCHDRGRVQVLPWSLMVRVALCAEVLLSFEQSRSARCAVSAGRR